MAVACANLSWTSCQLRSHKQIVLATPHTTNLEFAEIRVICRRS